MRVELIQTFLKAFQDDLGGADAELGQLPEEPDVLDLGLDFHHVGIIIQLLEFGLEEVDQFGAQILEVLGDGGCEPGVEGYEGDLRAGYLEEDLGGPLPPALLRLGGPVVLEELRRPLIDLRLALTLQELLMHLVQVEITRLGLYSHWGGVVICRLVSLRLEETRQVR